MTKMEDIKLENIRNIVFIKQYLSKTNLSTKIIIHPRYDSILWKISTLMRDVGVKAFSPEAINLLDSILVVQKDGSIAIFKNDSRTASLTSTRYLFDEDNNKLRRIFCETTCDGSEITSISTYDEEGIEESLMLSQKLIDGSKYYSNTVRVPDRIDMIKIESISEKNKQRERLEDAYQIRTFCFAYEDINPTADEIDPLDIIHLSFLGVPEIYRDLESDEKEIIEECDGEIFPLDDDNKERQLKDYMETNKFYGRTRKFERAIARYLDIEDRLPEEGPTSTIV